MPLSSGARIGPYEIVSLLGRGGMGEVYRAHDSRLQRDVAVKVLSSELSGEREAVSRFEREARAVAALNHPNIVSLHDVGHANDVAYAVTELLEGETLRQRLARNTPMPLQQTLDIAVQVARGVGAAHARGIVHRDLKPENLFITADRRVKVLDFGLARHAPMGGLETIVETTPGTVIGTIGYIAPEVIRGEPATAASDVFAFGVVLYEMLAGSNPFTRRSPVETLTALIRDDPPRLARVAPSTPMPLARLVERCLQKVPGDRPESMRDVAFYLENVETTSGSIGTTSDERADTPSTAGQGASLRRLPILLSAASVIALLALTMGLVSWLERRDGPAVATDGLARAQTLVDRVQMQRLARLRVAARAYASNSNVRALFALNDAVTATSSLEEYLSGLQDPPLLVLLTTEGRLLGRTGGSAVTGARESADWQRVLERPNRGGVIAVNGEPYHAVGEPADAAGATYGTVVAALPVDEAFARELRDLLELDVVLLDGRGIRGSTLLAGAVPWRSLDAWHAAGGRTDAITTVTADGATYRAREVPLALQPQLSAVLLSSRESTQGPYQLLRIGVVVAAVLVLGVAALAGRALA